jgi:hypothetical protein
MAPMVNTRQITRPLYAWEHNQVALVFGARLLVEKVLVHEFAAWPDQIDDLGRKLKKIAPRGSDVHNAITLGYNCYFPVGFPIDPTGPADLEFYKMGWMIHELTHCWQFQRLGSRYLYLALKAQFGLGEGAYDFGGAPGLVEKRKQGWKIFDFNLEQQGNITAAFYNAQCNLPNQMEMVAACWPYIEDIQENG